MDLFQEIDEVKNELPHIKTINKKLSKIELNGYQIFSIVTFIICFIFGIVLGNLFPTCNNTSIYSDVCMGTEFNIFLTLVFWFSSLLVCLLFYGLGDIIRLLSNINKNLSK